MSSASRANARVFELVRRHGWNATSFQTLEEGYRYFFHGGGCVAYVERGGAWIAAGAPLAPTAEIPDLVRAFLREARRRGRRACFFGTEERLLRLADDQLRSVCIGEQPVWNPERWAETLATRRSLREQLRRARAKGVSVRRLSTSQLEAGASRLGIERVAARWVRARRALPMGFLVRLELFSHAHERRCFVAERDGEVVGVAALVPVPARQGWFLEDLLRDPAAPNGTTELLVDAVMAWAREEACRWLTLGLAPLSGDVSALLRVARSGGRAFYDFEGLRAYRAKLDPERWLPIYLSHPPTQSGWRSLLDALVAFAPGRPELRFTRVAEPAASLLHPSSVQAMPATIPSTGGSFFQPLASP